MSSLSTSCFLSRWFHSVLWTPRWILEAKAKDFLCDAPTVRIPVVPCDGKVWLGNTWSSVNHPICFLMSHVTHPTLNELLARSLGVLSQTGIYGSEERQSGFTFQKALRFFFFLSNSRSPTLHSDQSFPGIPVRLCSKTGIDPRKTKEIEKERCHFFFFQNFLPSLLNCSNHKYSPIPEIWHLYY